MVGYQSFNGISYNPCDGISFMGKHLTKDVPHQVGDRSNKTDGVAFRYRERPDILPDKLREGLAHNGSQIRIFQGMVQNEAGKGGDETVGFVLLLDAVQYIFKRIMKMGVCGLFQFRGELVFQVSDQKKFADVEAASLITQKVAKGDGIFQDVFTVINT